MFKKITSTASLKNQLISRTSLAWLLAIQVFILAPHFVTVPVWIAVVWISVAFWRWKIFQGAWNYPGKLKKNGIGFNVLLGIICKFRCRFSV